MAEKWTKTSSPDWRWMNPNPLLALNHFTVPCSLTDVSLFCLSCLMLSPLPSATKKGLQVWNLQPLSTIPKVLQEQQTHLIMSCLSAAVYAIRRPRRLRRCMELSGQSSLRVSWSPFLESLGNLQHQTQRHRTQMRNGASYGACKDPGRTCILKDSMRRNIPESVLDHAN